MLVLACVCLCVLCICLIHPCTSRVLGTHRSQKRGSDVLELEIQKGIKLYFSPFKNTEFWKCHAYTNMNYSSSPSLCAWGFISEVSVGFLLFLISAISYLDDFCASF